MTLADCLGYDPETGYFWWKRSRGGKLAGNEAGCIVTFQDGGVYRVIGFNGKTHIASRLAHEIMTGAPPPGLIDHADRDTLNDRWGNLRVASHCQNGHNRVAARHNKVGVKGVSWDKERHKWVARIKVPGGPYKHLGRYDTVAAASSSRPTSTPA